MSAAHAHGAAAATPSAPVGQKDQFVNLQTVVDSAHSQALNIDSKTQLASILSPQPGILRTDATVDNELIVVVQFRESVKLRGFKLQATEAKLDSDVECSGPKTLRIFVQRPSYSFSECASEEPTETINLTPEQLKGEKEIPLKFVKYQNVTSLTIFVSQNQDDAPVTFINKLDFIGSIRESSSGKLQAVGCDC